MAVYDDLIDDVLPDLYGSPPLPLVQLAIKQAVRRFIQRSQCLRRVTPALNWPGGAGEKTLNNATFGAGLVSATEHVHAIKRVWWGDKKLSPRTTEELDAEFGGAWSTMTGEPLYYTQVGDGITLVPAPPVSTGLLKLEIAYGPSDGTETFPTSLLHDHREYLASGAMARVMTQSQKPWSDPTMALYHQQRFDSRVNSARLKADRGTSAVKLETKRYDF